MSPQRLTMTCAILLSLTACNPENESMNTSEQIELPQSPAPATIETDTVDNYFGTVIKDPYRWLEDDLSPETADWIARQNQYTRGYLDDFTLREEISDTLYRLINFEREGAPFFEGDSAYFYRNTGLQNQSVLYRINDSGEDTVFLDPNTFSDDGTVSMSGVSFSSDGSLVAYQLSVGGSDWRRIEVRDVETGALIDTALENVKFSNIAWVGNSGFYYSSYEKPEGSELSEKTDQHLLFFHTIGQPQTSDELVFGGTDDEKSRYVSASVTQDDRFLVISASNTTSGNRLWVRDLSDASTGKISLFSDEQADAYVLDNDDNTLLIRTNLDAPKGRIIAIDLSDPKPQNWVDVIPEGDHVINVRSGAGYLFAESMVNAISQVTQYTLDGRFVRTIELPDFGTASGFGGKRDQERLFFSFTNYRIASAIFELEPESGEVSLYRASKSPFNGNKYKTEQVFYDSKDGTSVPMIITYGVDTKLDGSAPTMLYGYGGFNISLRPRFSNTVAAWLEMGGIYAVPNLRGGGEYGKAWHLAGTKMQKQNVFDDFIAAAEYLIANGYTSKGKLALRGGSNGGLLVAAVTTQRPDLFQVSLPAVGVLDMLRYHKFTAGAGWAYDYGTSEESPEMFEYLLGYSPLHNTRPGTEYPATLITTAERDDRVVPAHSYKFAAQLQKDHTGDTPVMIRIESDAGHGAGTPISKQIELYTDLYSFALKNMGIEKLSTTN